MGEPLTSKLFTGPDVDEATKKKLQDCADGRPSEIVSHFSTSANRSGEHIRLVQEALKRAEARDPSLKLPSFAVDGFYSKEFADAVFEYKKQKNILNYAHKVDNIVGIKTIHSLDAEARGGKADHHDFPPSPGPKPVPRPRPVPAVKCVPEAECPTTQNFEATILMGASGGEVFNLARYWVNIRDTINNLSSLYLLTVGGVGASPLPVSGSIGGEPTPFATSRPCRVCNFGPAGSFGEATQSSKFNIALMSIQFRIGDGFPHMTLPFKVDTGFLSIPGGDLNVGKLTNITPCGKDGIGTGARRGFFSRGDLAGIESF